jgi:fused signal recognition particle receptor
MLIVLIAVAVTVLVLGSATLVVVSRRRGRGVELEPPPSPPLRPVRGPRQVVPEAAPELTPEQLAEIEEALTAVEAVPAPPETVAVPSVPEAVAPVKPRLRDRLGKARSLLAGYLNPVRSRDRIDEDTWEQLEEALILADVGVETTSALLDDLRGQVKRDAISHSDELLAALKADLIERLAGERRLRFEPGGPNVWLFVGVNGVGKTTTIGKVGLREAAEGRTVVMAAGDTFRAAAADQLALWAERVGADVVRGAEGGDPGAVVFDAVERAAARKADLVLADTAGRLHTKVNLMQELKKVRRVAERLPGQLTEVLLVIDATTGQNGLVQAKEFTAAVGVTGVVLTKLDGTAKGGIALAIEAELGIPIKLVGLGESAEDLVEFDPGEFVDALFS